MVNDIRIDTGKLHPLLKLYLERIIKYSNEAGIYLIITEGLRSVEEQDKLYAKGRTTPGPTVTDAKGSDYQSQHQWGIAFDIAIANNGHTWDEAYFKKVADIAKEHCKYIGWGGDWKKPVDRPHFYLDKWGCTTYKLKLKYKTPEVFMKTFKKKVTGTKKGLSIWNKRKTKRLTKKYPNGSTFRILSEGIIWDNVYYKGTYGWALKKYLK